jgi:thymidylate synthase (FAD)
MKITLLHNNDLKDTAHAIRTCWGSFDKSDNGGQKDKDLIIRVGNKFKHKSTLEHLHYTFFIQGISRATLQELARHRMASLSVKSTRYTLKELKEEEVFLNKFNLAFLIDLYSKNEDEIKKLSNEDKKHYDELKNALKRGEKYLVFTDRIEVNIASLIALENLRALLKLNIANDKAKFALPENYKTELTWSINARSLQNFLALRSGRSALWEIRTLAYNIFDCLPDEHKIIYEDDMEAKR